MLRMRLLVMDISDIACANPQCKNLIEYTYNVIGHVYRIRRKTTCLVVSTQFGTEYYCRDCIDTLYRQLKPSLDSKLWIFK
jgi:hypothetical protein